MQVDAKQWDQKKEGDWQKLRLFFPTFAFLFTLHEYYYCILH